MAHDVIFFCHIPKAGGETLKQYFYRFVSEDRCLKVWDVQFGADVSAEQFRHIDRTVINAKSAIYGHLSVQEFLKNPAASEAFEEQSALIVASVRDPVDRIISLYNYIMVNEFHPSHQLLKNIKFDEFALTQPSNQQVSYLSGADQDVFELMARPNFRITALENSVRFFATLFSEEYGQYWDATPRNETRPKVGQSLVTRGQIDLALDKELIVRNAHDLQLYNQVRQARIA